MTREGPLLAEIRAHLAVARACLEGRFLLHPEALIALRQVEQASEDVRRLERLLAHKEGKWTHLPGER